MSAAQTAKSRCAALSILSNSLLIVFKVIAGMATGSVAIISEAVHSFLDLMASLMAWVAVRISDNPPDYDHPFGHGRAENLAALMEALLIVLGGALIARESVLGLFEGKALPSLKAGLLVMLVSTVVNYLISRHLFKVGRALGSPALEADAWHLRTDVYTSLGIFLALLAIEVGRMINPEWKLDFIDSACALLVSFLIMRTGVSLGWDSVSTLIDNRLSPKELLLISDHIQAFYPKVISWRRLRTRRAGPFRIVIVDLVVDGKLPVSEAHAIGLEVVRAICRHFPGADMTFHLEPFEHADQSEGEGQDGPSPSDPTGGVPEALMKAQAAPSPGGEAA
ncbi:MAG: cation diffusion facilitator family transporter [Deltaproteobacteria bacterium]|jgi:cation diffusion facilitator family transporter|nr:cation diffusion facilitator family transporter [Deltaproteobacteria bacterium]